MWMRRGPISVISDSAPTQMKVLTVKVRPTRVQANQ